MASRTIAVVNQKGGVGKTTTVASLAAAFGARGHALVVIDADPQANLTSSLGVAPNRRGTYELLMREATVAECVVSVLDACLRVIPEGSQIDLIPGSPDLAGIELELATATDRTVRLRERMRSLSADYAFCLIDCPPSLGTLTLNALAVATEVLVPVQCEYLALEGLAQLLETIRRVRDHLNPNLRQLHLLMTMFDGRTGLSQSVVEEVRTHFPDLFVHTTIPRTVRLGEAPSHGLAIQAYDPSGKGAEAYRALAAEMEQRAPRSTVGSPAIVGIPAIKE